MTMLSFGLCVCTDLKNPFLFLLTGTSGQRNCSQFCGQAASAWTLEIIKPPSMNTVSGNKPRAIAGHGQCQRCYNCSGKALGQSMSPLQQYPSSPYNWARSDFQDAFLMKSSFTEIGEMQC